MVQTVHEDRSPVNLQSEKKGKFPYRNIVRSLLLDASINSHPYEIDNLTYQVHLANGFELTTEYNPLTPEEQFFQPVKLLQKVHINAPPLVPHVDDELLPQDLFEVVSSIDPSKPPSIADLRCIEILLDQTNIFKNKSELVTKDVYRIDLTKDPPVGYKRRSIPDHETIKADDSLLVAAMKFIQPDPAYTYDMISEKELQSVFNTALKCKKEGQKIDPNEKRVSLYPAAISASSK